MSRGEWLRTFVAVYRTGSVTIGARSRGLSQPAASQHLTALSRAAGGPLLARAPGGVAPTQRGRELYARVAEPLDRLEPVLSDLDGGRLRETPALRVGSTAELFETVLLPVLAPAGPLDAVFGSDQHLVGLLAAGDLDLAVTAAAPPRRPGLDSVPVGRRTYALVAAPALAPDPRPDTLAECSEALAGLPWVSYSHELPLTRRMWTAHLGRPFDNPVRLVAPDLRAVATAVEQGVGVSLLPAYACARGLRSGRLVHVFDVASLLPEETWHAVTRRADSAHRPLQDALQRLTALAAPV